MKEVAMAFVMKGLTLNLTSYNTAWGCETWGGEFDFIQDVENLVAFDLGRYLEKVNKCIDVQVKCNQVCEAVGHVLIEFVLETSSLPEDDDWELILSTIKARAEGRQYVLDMLYNPPSEPELPKTIGELKGEPPKRGDKVMLSAMGKSKYHDNSMTPHDAEGVVMNVRLHSRNIDSLMIYSVAWDDVANDELLAEDLVVVEQPKFSVGDTVTLSQGKGETGEVIHVGEYETGEQFCDVLWDSGRHGSHFEADLTHA